ncbi:hypothetical protein K488DRAFT_87266 [Vararia minispora EC-137]|uniref:Uncharacterized protein n=1 Tax=Vararia minispora EC-137 TaxID=1314806 RepID=A0ACB8QGM9_9AGAM|nr:hypothetical protein K488DRAFT_87266 [Vararia minispora EC-137]
MVPTADIKLTLGAILAGGLTSVALSGVVAVLGFFYFRIYPRDASSLKSLVRSPVSADLFGDPCFCLAGKVGLIWLLDAVHSVLIAVSIWKYFILSFGDPTQSDVVYEEIALTIAVTATLTYIVHMFFAIRVYRLSKANWLITAPIMISALARLGCAIGTTVKMSQLHSYSGFVAQCGWIFTLGLAFSTVTDILIAMTMCYFLQNSRTGYGKMDDVIGILLIYTFNNGALTCLATITAMICWIVMHTNNLIFFGIHFCIAKLYAMSLLITLNTRRSIRKRAQTGDDMDYQMPVRFPSSFGKPRSRSAVTHFTRPDQSDAGGGGGGGGTQSSPDLEISINVEKTIHFDVDDADMLQALEPSRQPSPANPPGKPGLLA